MVTLTIDNQRVSVEQGATVLAAGCFLCAVEIEGRRFTPPVDCGLLGGTYRGWMLETGAVAERTITIEELRGSPRVLLVNSVRGETEVQFAASPAADAIGTPAARWDAP